ncbi:hypothetical protein E1267_21965 [Nonomuraea longispora]|uniref:Uncharacterized protein n=1 Tax=Nonomuraea longispora TaxID=1848320 RepID=A0A4R4N9D7_9ACTN|nr:hypothetical protein [Nonomuraea longispora]TDC04734.1 hypothetical protein E1267_21965 [Nonomuraea longispora]
MQRPTGLLVGAVFGAVFVVVNAQGPPNVLTVKSRVAARLAAAEVVLLSGVVLLAGAVTMGLRALTGRPAEVS